MKVFILTEGGKDIGLGHITRCTSIYQAFQEVGLLPEFIVNGDNAVQDLLKGVNCRFFDWLNDWVTLFANAENTDIVFIDSYLADYDLYKKISDLVETAVYLDDNVRIDYPKGFVLNGAIFAEKMPYPEKIDVTYLLGTRYAPLRKEFWDCSEKHISDNIKTVMITFGGTDIHNLAPKVLKLLGEVYPKILKKAIIAKCFANVKEIRTFEDENTELIYYPDAAEMKKVMLECDIAISAGGQTLYELASMGVPTIAVCVAENQSQNVSGWSKAEAMEYVGMYNDKSFLSKLKASLEKMMPYDIRAGYSRRTRLLIDGKGAKRVRDIVLH